MGRIYQQTFIYPYATVASAKPYDGKIPITTGEILRLLDLGQEVAEFDRAMTLIAAADDPAGGNVQGGEQ